MKLKNIISFAVTAVLTMSFPAFAQAETGFKAVTYNFTAQYIKGAKSVSSVREYDYDRGYGFVNTTTAMPQRTVNMSKINAGDNGFTVTEQSVPMFDTVDKDGNKLDINKATCYNYGGMVFRIKAPAGGYHIEAEVEGGENNALLSVSAMQTYRLENSPYWDAAKKVPNLHPAKWKGDVWSFDYANGRDFIDIEIEAREINKPVTLKTIKITPVENKTSDKPSVYLLGDSTLKSYLFEEAPMCGWGQVFDRLFDNDKVNIVNYSMGGRSVKQMYQEGRLNDILMTGSEGDFILIQSGHNDEKKGSDIGTASDSSARFGVGSTEAMYREYLEKCYIPAIRARGMVPVLVTPMTRASKYENGEFKNSFTSKDREFPKVMREAAAEMDVPLVDLNKLSCEYLTEIGYDAAMALVMSLEAGETPGKTNSGSYANGHPDNKIDTTHMKEALAKQYALIVADEIKTLSNSFSQLKPMAESMTEDVKEGNIEKIYPEICKDVTGENAYYRNQIEKIVQLGLMSKDSDGCFNPKAEMTVEEYADAMEKLYGSDRFDSSLYGRGVLTREVMAKINLDAYNARYSEKPKYMTDYNGTNISPDDPEYDPNLVGEEAQYYPLAGYGNISDKDKISEEYKETTEKAYELGLIRSEDVERGKMENGCTLDPQGAVTREKAAKYLYFMYVLGSDINSENDIVWE
ncbi:MAG: GDSL-type esterase/lipase family protein [Clostridia bacterium]|nr:GDSL-type esterase/lipase family protein [Clostridia bacterium]